MNVLLLVVYVRVGEHGLLRYEVAQKLGLAPEITKSTILAHLVDDSLQDRRTIRQRTLDRAAGTNDGPILPVLECEPFVYKRHSPRTLAHLNADLVTGSSSSLSSSSLSRLPSADRGVTLRSRFSVAGSDAGYSDTVEGDYSHFGEAYGIYRS